MKTKKEIKEEYKQMKFPMGVFQIRNLQTNKVFIDNSTDMDSKWGRHKMELKFGSHRNTTLQKDWNEYGEENFAFEILSELKQDNDRPINYQRELKRLQQETEEKLGDISRYS